MIKVICVLPSQIESWYDLHTPPILISKVEKGKYYYVKEVDWCNSWPREMNVFAEHNSEIPLGKYHKICFKSINEIRSNNLDKILGND